ncbi:MAG: DNA polymerase IV [Clostridia bacterium]|nr:DNA polymerase IV [Clostridia bacterium]
MERVVFHVDVNSAFLSWSAVRQCRAGGEDLRRIPSVVSGDPGKRTSVVLAKSIPAKVFHIRTGEPITAALRKCPHLVITPPDFTLYSACSRAFKDICREYTPTVEEFSIDECFLDMSGMGRIYPDLTATAHEIKDRIHRELGFTVNIGVGSNKLLAKMASDFEKPDRVHTLFASEIAQKLWPLPIEDLLFLGGATAQKLRRMRVNTIGDLAGIDPQRLQAVVGKSMSRSLIASANGIDESPVTAERPRAKSYGHSLTMEEDVKDAETAGRILLALTDAAASRLRRDGGKAGSVSVQIRSDRFQNRSHQRHLPQPTDVTRRLYETATALFAEMWDGKTPLRLLGVSLTDIRNGEGEQICLFEEEEHEQERQRKLDAAVDTIRSRYGRGAVQPGSVMTMKKPKKT